MTIELSEEELQEVVKSLVTERFVQVERGLSARKLTTLIDQLRLQQISARTHQAIIASDGIHAGDMKLSQRT